MSQEVRVGSTVTAAVAMLAGDGEIHCVVGGAPGEPSAHCQACGARRPLELSCDGCATVTRVPLHLLSAKHSKSPLHCFRCGEQVRSSLRPVAGR